MADGIRKVPLGADRLTNAAVWSEIRDLDSLTDYREYLPHVNQRALFSDRPRGPVDPIPISSALDRILLAILACILLLFILRS